MKIAIENYKLYLDTDCSGNGEIIKYEPDYDGAITEKADIAGFRQRIIDLLEFGETPVVTIFRAKK